MLISDLSSVPDEEGDCISTHQAQWQQEATGSSLTAGIKDWKEKDFYSSPLPRTEKNCEYLSKESNQGNIHDIV